eukprot:11414734-Ditylum_brightwellii.AAC.1
MQDGQDRSSACYVHYSKQSTFHHHIYGEDKTIKLLLVHYLDTFVVYKVSADHVFTAATKECLRKESIDTTAAVGDEDLSMAVEHIMMDGKIGDKDGNN